MGVQYALNSISFAFNDAGENFLMIMFALAYRGLVCFVCCFVVCLDLYVLLCRYDADNHRDSHCRWSCIDCCYHCTLRLLQVSNNIVYANVTVAHS